MHHLHDCLLVRVKQDLRFPNRSPKHHSCSLLKGHPDSRWSPGRSHTHVPGHARDIKENVIPQTTPSSSIAPVLMLTCPSLVLLTVKRGQHVHPVVCSYAVHTQQTVLHCVFWHVPFKTSFNFFCNLSYRSLSVRSDDKGQSLVPICINMAWWSMTLLLVHYCLFLGPVLIDAHHGRTELLHKNGSFGFDPVELAFLTLLKRHQRWSFASGTPLCVSNWNQTSSTNLWFTEFSVYLHLYSNSTF